MPSNIWIFRCGSFWSFFRLVPGKKRLPNRSMHLKRHLRLLNGILPKLLGLRPPASPHRLQHWRRWPLRLRPRHRTCRPHKTWGRGNVHILLLLNRHRTTRWHSLHLPIMAGTLHRLLHTLLPLPRCRPSFSLGVTEVVPRTRQSERGHETHALHCQVKRKPRPRRSPPNPRRRRKRHRSPRNLRELE